MSCRDASCSAGAETLAATCNGAGACPRVDHACNAYVCGADACLTSCSGLADCASGYLCDAEACVPDLTPPTVTLDPQPRYTNQPTITVTGKVTDAGGVAGATLSFGSAAVPLTLGADGSFVAEVALVEGANAIRVEGVDRAGLRASSAADVVLDTVAPVVTIDAPAAGHAFGASLVQATVGVVDAAPITGVNVGGQAAALMADGVRAAEVVLATEGANVVMAAASDAAGNVGFASVPVLLDFSFPIVTSDLADGARFGPLPGDLLLVTAHVDDLTATTVRFSDGLAVELDRGGVVVQDAFTLASGLNALWVDVQDETGRTTRVAWNVTYDVTAPSGDILSPAAGAFVRGTIEASATAADDLSGVASVRYGIDTLPRVGATAAGAAWTGTFRLHGPRGR